MKNKTELISRMNSFCDAMEHCTDCPVWESYEYICEHVPFQDLSDEMLLKVADKMSITYKVLNDPVNHPAHYTDGKIEVIDFITDKKLGFCLGNAVKYISRAGKKDPAKEIEDLQKSVWYINRHIKNLEENQTK